MQPYPGHTDWVDLDTSQNTGELDNPESVSVEKKYQVVKLEKY